MGYRSSVQYWFEGKNAVSIVMEHMVLAPNQECFNAELNFPSKPEA